MPFILKPVLATYIDWSSVRLRGRERLRITTEDAHVFHFRLVEGTYPFAEAKKLVLDWGAVPAESLEEVLEICRFQVDGDRKSEQYSDAELMEMFQFEINGGSRETWTSSSPEVGRHLWTTLWRNLSSGINARLPGGRVTVIESVVLPRDFKPQP